MTSTQTSAKPAIGLIEFIALMALMTSLVALSIDAMLPALERIGEDLNSQSIQQTHLIVSLFFLGMAFGQLFYGPFSDTRGRRAAILSGLIIFAIGTLICMWAPNMEVMLIGRVIQAFGVSGPRIAAMAVIRDQYAGEAMARVMSFIMMVFILVPMVAPAFGQAILLWFDWQHIFTAFLVIGAASGLWFFSRQPETLPKDKRQPFSWSGLWLSSRAICRHRKVMGYTFAMGLVFGPFLTYLSASQTLFQHIYGVGDLFPLYFAALAFSVGLASFINGTLVMRLGMKKLCYWAIAGLLVGSLVLVVAAIVWQGRPPLLALMAMLFFTFFWIGVLFGNLNAMAMHPLGDMAGLGAAIIGFVSSLVSVPIAILIGGYIEGDIYPIAWGFLIFAVLTALSVFWAEMATDENELAAAPAEARPGHTK